MKVSRVRKLLRAITRCDTVQEMRNLVEAIDITQIQDIIKERSRNVEVERVESLVHSLRSRLKETTKNEDSLFEDIKRLLRAEKDKLEGIKADFAKVHSYLSLIVLLLQGDSESHEISKWADEAMRLMSPEKSLPYLAKVKTLLTNLWNSISPRLGAEVDEVIQIAFELSHVLEFDLVSVRWIHEFRDRLDKESGPVQKKKKKVTGLYEHLLTKKTQMLRELLEDNHLTEGRLHETITEYKSDEKLKALVEMLLLDIMSIFQSNGRLSENPYFLDNSHPLLLGQNLRKHLAHENALVRELADVDMDVLLVANTVVSTTNTIDLTDKVLKNDPLMLMDSCRLDLKVVVWNQTRLFEALEEGNISLARKCVQNGADIHGRDLRDKTALHFASNLECARFAVKSGVKQNWSCDQFGCTALHSAALNGRADVVTYMIDELEMGVDCRDNFLNTPLHLSAEKGHSAVVKALLERGASTGAVDASWNTPLHSAVGSGQLQTAKLLLNEEVHADAGRTVVGFTPLHISSEKGFEDLVKYLLEIGAEIDLGTDDGFTALHRACLTGRVEVVKILLSRGAKVSVLSVSGHTPAHLAAKNGHCSVLSLLCQKGCKLNCKDKIDGRTPLHLAAINGHKDAVSVLLEKGCDVGKKDMSSKTPLHLACFSGSEDIVKKLLESGASVNAVDDDGTTPLHVAVCKSSFEIVKLLLEHGADPNAIHLKRKCSAIHIACVYGSETIVQLLIERGSFIDVKDKHGETPLTLSITSLHLDIAALLMQSRADIQKKNDLELDALSLAAIKGLDGVLKQLVSLGAETDSKSLCFACTSGSLKAVQFLLSCGLDVNSAALGSTPLHEAARGNHKDIVKLLIGLGADPKSKNQNDFTPMFDAVKLNFKDIVDELLKAGAEVDMDLLMMAVNHGGELMEVLLRDRPVDFEEETILLHAACRAGMKSTADVLLSRGVPVNCVDDKGVPLLLSSVIANQHDIVDYLLSKGADPDAGAGDQTTPLLAACASGHLRTVAALIKAGCRVEENIFEMTVINGHLNVLKLLLEEKCVDDALKKQLFRLAVSVGQSDIVKHMARNGIAKGLVHLAALNGHLDLLTFFLSNRLVDVNERTETGETILQYAAYGKHCDLIESLLNFGAQVDGTDAFGSTPAHVVASQGNAPFLKLLLQRGAVHDPLNFRGLTPLQVAEERFKFVEVESLLRNTSLLFEAVKKKDLKRTKDLLTKGAVSNASARDGSTPLHLASWKGSRDVVKLLLQNGADPNTKGKGGSTPLHYAAKHGHTGVVLALLMGGAQFDPRSASIKTPLNLSKRPSQASDLLDLVHRTFRAVRNGECSVIEELKRSPSDWIKAVLRCRDSENRRTLVVTAIRYDFPRMNLLKNLLQTDDNVEQIVTTLRAVQDFTKLLSVLRSLLDTRSIAFGPDSPFVLDVKEEIALAVHGLGQHKEALIDLKRVLQKRIETVGMGDDILRTQRNVAFMLFLQNKYAESVRVYKELYRKQLQIFGPVDADAVRSLLHIAMNTFAMAKYDEAVRKCDELMETVKIQKDSAYLQAMSVKASALQMKKDLDKALILFKKVHETRKRVLGHGHPETVTSLNNIMSVLEEQGKHLEALTVCKEILDAQSSSALHKPPEILKTFASMGKIFMRLGLHFEAYKTFKTLLKRGYQDEEIKKSVEVLEVRYAFVFPRGGIEGVLKEPTGVFEGGDLRQMDAAELRRRDSLGRTALHHCVMTGNEAEARLLLRRGVEVLLADHRGENPIQLATRLGRYNMVEILLRHVRLSSPWVLQS